MIHSISAKEVMNLIDIAPDTIELIDVRSTGEYDEVHIPSARNIPLHILPVRMNEINKSKEIVFVCRSGGRSAQATMFATQAGIPAYNLSGGMNSFENDYPEHVVRSESQGFLSKFF